MGSTTCRAVDDTKQTRAEHSGSICFRDGSCRHEHSKRRITAPTGGAFAQFERSRSGNREVGVSKCSGDGQGSGTTSFAQAVDWGDSSAQNRTSTAQRAVRVLAAKFGVSVWTATGFARVALEIVSNGELFRSVAS